MKLPVVKAFALGILALSAYPMKTKMAPAAEEANPWRPSAVPAANADGFVLIRGGTFWSGDIVTRRGNPSLVRMEDFELLDHPVTNAEYKRFVDSTGHAPPLYWVRGSVPPGTENHPVVYINRYDTDAYASWRSKSEGRAYRLPTDAEFEYAARAGLDRKLYPWGDDDPSGRANYDSAGSRLYDTWRTHLKQVIPLPIVPNETGRGNVVMVADLLGDFRDEFVVTGLNDEGHFTVWIYGGNSLINSRKLTRTARHDYRMWMAHNLTGGYGSYFEPED